MKKLLLPLAVLFFLFNNVTAQLIADAGPDAVVCQGASFTIGGNPTASGGTPPYTYSWNAQVTGNFTPTLANPVVSYLGIYSGVRYTVIVTDNLGQQGFDTAFVSMYDDVIISTNVSDSIVCVGDTLSFTASFTGGTPPFNYAWHLEDTTVVHSLNTQFAPTRASFWQPRFSVTDSTGCAVDAAPWDRFNNIYNAPGIIVLQNCGAFTLSKTDACNGNCNGTAAISPAGNYFYEWHDNHMSYNNFTAHPTDLCPGIHFGLMLDSAFHPIDWFKFTINNVAQCGTFTMTQTNTTCNGACNGTATVNTAGNYRFLWSNSATTVTVANLCPGTYSVTVMDSVLTPLDTLSVIITQPAILTVTGGATNATCAGVGNGSIYIAASGGTSPYTYSWSNGSTARNPTALSSGTYTVTVTSGGGCSATASFNISAPPNLLTLTTTHTNITCASPDSAVLVITNGTPNFSVSWGDGSIVHGLGPVFLHDYFIAGAHTITVTDTNFCSATITDTILTLLGYSYYVYASGSDANCMSDGTATASVYGGTAPLSYSWSNGGSTSVLTGLTGGDYIVTVSDGNGCSRTGSVHVDSVCYNLIYGYLFNDTNGNCLRDSGELAVVSQTVRATSGSSTFYGYTNASGYYEIMVSMPGNFAVRAIFNNGYGSCAVVNTCVGQTVSFSTVGDTATADLGFSPSANFNLAIHPGWHTANPGFTKDYWVLYNQTNVPPYSGPATIVFKYDSILQYQSSNNGGINNAVAHTVTWTVGNVPYPMWDWMTKPEAFFLVPANTPLNYQLTQEFWIYPTSGDCDSSNNHLLVTQVVTGSRDPNEKEVEPAGDIVEEDSVLTYTIHFQNTGNDTTWFVVLKDTLSQYIDPATVQNIASSHEYSSFDITGEGILTWVFNPIFLVDSTTNEPASKGWVMFKVKKKNNLPLTTLIGNKAHIYFDYNEPIVTNTVTNTLTGPNYVFTVRSDDNISVVAMPNPFTQSTQIVVEGVTSAFEFELFDVAGKKLKKISSINENRFELKREEMSAGVYFYRITTISKQRAYGRLVVN